MIDFTELPKKKKAYNGVNGSKICVLYQDEPYMLKFPPQPTINQELSYTNSCISEYLGCHILASMGLPVQETLLGVYRIHDKEKIVVACKDFATNGVMIQDFGSLKNQIIDSSSHGKSTDLYGIIETIEKQEIIDQKQLSDFFWDTFIADALIGNWDRHNGNWGFLYNPFDDSIKIAPLWDCGSSLYPQADEATMKLILTDKNAMNQRIYTRPTSAITIDGKRVNYLDFISSNTISDCTDALIRISKRIDMDVISDIIDHTEFISEFQKQFYKTMVNERKERILDRSLIILKKKELAKAETFDLENEIEL